MRYLYSFGFNEDGQCGVKKNQSTSIKLVKFFTDNITIDKVSAGSRHTLALTNNGYVFAWGWGLLGQLGIGHTHSVDHPSPIDPNILSGIIVISAGGIHSGAVDKLGLLYTWGSNSYGQLGIGDNKLLENVIAKVPVKVTHESIESIRFVNLSCGGMHSAAVDSDGNVYCWGRSDNGQTGYSTRLNNCRPILDFPTKVTSLQEPIVDVSCGGFHTLLLSVSGVAYAMGKDDFGLLGIGSNDDRSMTAGIERPVPIELFIKQSIKVKAIETGGWHSCFISNKGDLYTCGKGEYGRLGTGTEISHDEPTAVSLPIEGSEVIQVSAGGSHTMWLTNGGEVYVVGRSDDDRLGIDKSLVNNKKRLVTPNVINIVDVIGTMLYSVNQIECGGSHSFILLDCNT